MKDTAYPTNFSPLATFTTPVAPRDGEKFVVQASTIVFNYVQQWKLVRIHVLNKILGSPIVIS